MEVTSLKQPSYDNLLGLGKRSRKHPGRNRDNPFICRRLRAQLAAKSPILLPDGSHFVFLNRLTYFDTILCFEGKLASVEDLEVISRFLYNSRTHLCPTTVWVIKDGMPTLVRIRPGSHKTIRMIRTSSPYQLAYVFYIIPKNEHEIKA